MHDHCDIESKRNRLCLKILCEGVVNECACAGIARVDDGPESMILGLRENRAKLLLNFSSYNTSAWQYVVCPFQINRYLCNNDSEVHWTWLLVRQEVP